MKTARLQKQVNSPALTREISRLKNRRTFVKAGNVTIRKAAQWHEPMTLIYVDVDHFGKFKREHGEAEANVILKKLGDCCKKLFRKEDVLAHLKGNEFLILLPGLYPEDALETLRRLRGALEDALRDCPSPITTNVGAVTYLSSIPSVSAMIKSVEHVIHAAKDSGKKAFHNT